MVYVIFSFKIIKVTRRIKTGFSTLYDIVAYLIAFEEEIFERLDPLTFNPGNNTIISGTRDENRALDIY